MDRRKKTCPRRRLETTSVGLAVVVLAMTGAGGCAGGPAGAQPVDVLGGVAPKTTGFDDLAAVLSATVNRHGRIDATALAAHLPRLQRQLTILAQPWPTEARDRGSDERLAWLYNARIAWSLRIVSQDLMPLARRSDAFDLPEKISQQKLLDSPFPLNGGTATLRDIDRELTAYDDFRLAVAAPCATDLFGPLPQTPFEAQTVRETATDRFVRFVLDPCRVVVDHRARRLRVPPALWGVADALTAEFNQRYNTRHATLAAALGAYLDARGRDKMKDAQGYAVVPRVKTAGIAAKRLTERQRRKRFGMGGEKP